MQLIKVKKVSCLSMSLPGRLGTSFITMYPAVIERNETITIVWSLRLQSSILEAS